jgi:hypothetical protein
MCAAVHEQFVNCRNWFERRYKALCDARYPTFKAALNLWLQSDGRTIVETGCIRVENDYGGGNSTVLFADVVSRHGGVFWTVDNNHSHLELAARMTLSFAVRPRCILADSVDFLGNRLPRLPDFRGRIDLLYLDSHDFPMGEIAARLGCRDELDVFHAFPDIDDVAIASCYPDLVDPPQQHCLAELRAALPWLHGRSVVLMDDNHLPGGGKPRLAKRLLSELGWRCVLDAQQTLWIAPKA